MGLPFVSVKNLPAIVGDPDSVPGSGRFPEEPGRLYGPWHCKDLDTTERLIHTDTHTHTHTQTHTHTHTHRIYRLRFSVRC